MEQMEENAISFWCKNGDKKAHYTYNWSTTHFQDLHIINNQLLRQPETTWRAKASENKRAEKKDSRRQNKFGKDHRKKSPKFGLCACAKLKYCTFLYQIFKKIYSFGRKSLFSKFEVHLALWQPTIGFNDKISLGTLRVNDCYTVLIRHGSLLTANASFQTSETPHP